MEDVDVGVVLMAHLISSQLISRLTFHLRPDVPAHLPCSHFHYTPSYRTLDEQRKSNHLEIRNDAFEQCTIKITQESSKMTTELSLDPGGRFSFEGKNPESRKIFKQEAKFDSTYDVVVKRGNVELPAELSVGQLLRIEGGEM